MHVGLNLIFLVPGRTGGMEVAARETIPALVAAAPAGTRFTAFVNRQAGPGPWGELVPKREVPVRVANRLEWVRAEQQLLPRLAASERVDVVHSLASTAPLWGRFRRVVTVHDLIYRRYP
ncbi:MAG TPA: glycosyltransferase family 1 protein, partial [Solirubrobacteraceae bacterium]|nr:glycosyltransferase family 1 protein [Solirubrobacteraceae bacterium]